MKRTRGVRLVAVLAAVGVVGGMAGGAAGQSGGGARGEPPLRGPRVQDAQAPGAAGSMSADGTGVERRGEERIPTRVFLEAVRSLEDDEAAPEVRLSEEQRAAIGELVEEFAQQRREYMRQHREELLELRAVAEREQEDGAAGEQQQRRRREAAARLREIERGGPRPEDLHRRIWAELTEAQWAAVEEALRPYREERARQREERYVRQRTGRDGGGEASGAPREMEREAAARRRAAERRDRLVRAFERLSPEEQEALLERLEQRVREREGGERGEAGPPARRGRGAPPRRPGPPPPPPPPPSMDEVEVPPAPVDESWNEPQN